MYCFALAFGLSYSTSPGRYEIVKSAQYMELERNNEKNKRENHSTQDSRVVPHRGTNWAAPWLTSQIGRDAVLSRSYGRGYLPHRSSAYKPSFLHPFPRSVLNSCASTTPTLDVMMRHSSDCQNFTMTEVNETSLWI